MAEQSQQSTGADGSNSVERMVVSEDSSTSLLATMERQTSILKRIMAVLVKTHKIDPESLESSNEPSTSTMIPEKAKDNNKPADKPFLMGEIFSDPLDNFFEASNNHCIADFFRQLGNAQNPVKSDSKSLFNQLYNDSEGVNNKSLIIACLRAIDAENYMATKFEQELKALISAFSEKMNSSYSASFTPIELSLETFIRQADNQQVEAIDDLFHYCLSELRRMGNAPTLPADEHTIKMAANCLLALSVFLNAIKGSPNSSSKFRSKATDCLVSLFTQNVNDLISVISDCFTVVRKFFLQACSDSLNTKYLMANIVVLGLTLLRRLFSPDYIAGLGEKINVHSVYQFFICFITFQEQMKMATNHNHKHIIELALQVGNFCTNTFFWSKDNVTENEKIYFGKTVRVTVTLTALLTLVNRKHKCYQRPEVCNDASKFKNYTPGIIGSYCTNMDTLVKKVEQHRMALPLDSSTLEELLLQLYIAFENGTGSAVADGPQKQNMSTRIVETAEKLLTLLATRLGGDIWKYFAKVDPEMKKKGQSSGGAMMMAYLSSLGLDRPAEVSTGSTTATITTPTSGGVVAGGSSANRASSSSQSLPLPLTPQPPRPPLPPRSSSWFSKQPLGYNPKSLPLPMQSGSYHEHYHQTLVQRAPPPLPSGEPRWSAYRNLFPATSLQQSPSYGIVSRPSSGNASFWEYVHRLHQQAPSNTTTIKRVSSKQPMANYARNVPLKVISCRSSSIRGSPTASTSTNNTGNVSGGSKRKQDEDTNAMELKNAKLAQSRSKEVRKSASKNKVCSTEVEMIDLDDTEDDELDSCIYGDLDDVVINTGTSQSQKPDIGAKPAGTSSVDQPKKVVHFAKDDEGFNILDDELVCCDDDYLNDAVINTGTLQSQKPVIGAKPAGTSSVEDAGNSSSSSVIPNATMTMPFNDSSQVDVNLPLTFVDSISSEDNSNAVLDNGKNNDEPVSAEVLQELKSMQEKMAVYEKTIAELMKKFEESKKD